jgi:hypothetical protein
MCFQLKLHLQVDLLWSSCKHLQQFDASGQSGNALVDLANYIKLAGETNLLLVASIANQPYRGGLYPIQPLWQCQYWVLGSNRSTRSQFSNKLGSDWRLIQSWYPVLGYISIWSPINTRPGIRLVTLLLVSTRYPWYSTRYWQQWATNC